jgi:hypothetical protein
MKLVTFLAFTAAVEAAVLNTPKKRQSNANFGLDLMQSVSNASKKPAKKASKTTKLEPVVFKHALRQKVTWGPFTLNPSNVRNLSSAPDSFGTV